MFRRSSSKLLHQLLQSLPRSMTGECHQSLQAAGCIQQQAQRRWWSADADQASKAVQKKQSKKTKQQDDDAPSTSASGGISQVGLLPYRRPRFQQFYDNIIARELLLKKNIGSYADLPRIQRIDLSFTAPDNFKQAYVEKWQMLFYALGLEYLTGRVPRYDMIQQKHLQGNETTGVRVSLPGPEAYEFLEKLALLLLPHQVAFTGIPLEKLDGAFSLSFSVKNLLALPDFEELFDVFEDLDGMQVRILTENVSSAEDCALLLSAFSIPTKIKPKKRAAAAAAAAAATAAPSEGAATAVQAVAA